jgi:hypothetical protein
LPWGEHDVADEGSNSRRGLLACFRIGQSLREVLHPRAVDLGHVRDHVWQVRRRVPQAGLDLGPLLLTLGHAHLHGRLIHAVFNGRHDGLDGPPDLLKLPLVGCGLRAALMVAAVVLLVMGAHRLGDGRG